MIIDVFMILSFLSIVFIILGYFREIPFLGMLGFFSMFLLSFVLINNNLEYKTGAVVDTSNPLSTSISYSLSSYNNSHTLGVYMAIIFAFLFILSIIRESGVYDIWREKYEENNY